MRVGSTRRTPSRSAWARGGGTDIVAVLRASIDMPLNWPTAQTDHFTILYNAASLIPQSPSPATSALLHPSLPPLLRPAPPLSALHFWTTETAEEKKARRELGLKVFSGRRRAGERGDDEEEGSHGSGSESDDEEEEEEDMDMDGKGGGGRVSRPRLGGEPKGRMRAGGVDVGVKDAPAALSNVTTTTTAPAPTSAEGAGAGAGTGQEAEQVLLVPVAPRDVRAGNPALDLAAGAPQPDDVVVLADTAKSDDTTHGGEGDGMDVDVDGNDDDGQEGGDVPDFIAASTSEGTVQVGTREAARGAGVGEGQKGGGEEEEDEDEGIPELDSGMSDFDDDDEDEDEEE